LVERDVVGLWARTCVVLVDDIGLNDVRCAGRGCVRRWVEWLARAAASSRGGAHRAVESLYEDGENE
jgi:hypothetical protein